MARYESRSTRDTTRYSTAKKPASLQPTPIRAIQRDLIQRLMADPTQATPEALQLLRESQGEAFVQRLAERPTAPTVPSGDLNSYLTQISANRARLTIQPKLTVTPAGDQYEQEADAVAAQVVQRMNAPTPAPAAVQRDHEDDKDKLQMMRDTRSIQRQIHEDDKDKLQMMRIQRQTGDVMGGLDVDTGVESRIQAARGGGSPIAEGSRLKLESAFGADFSGVRVHTDSKSDALNRSVQARAFTTGHDIFFRQGEYNLNSVGGQALLAHELTHVVQQRGTPAIQRQRLRISPDLQQERIITIDDPSRDRRTTRTREVDEYYESVVSPWLAHIQEIHGTNDQIMALVSTLTEGASNYSLGWSALARNIEQINALLEPDVYYGEQPRRKPSRKMDLEPSPFPSPSASNRNKEEKSDDEGISAINTYPKIFDPLQRPGHMNAYRQGLGFSDTLAILILNRRRILLRVCENAETALQIEARFIELDSQIKSFNMIELKLLRLRQQALNQWRELKDPESAKGQDFAKQIKQINMELDILDRSAWEQARKELRALYQKVFWISGASDSDSAARARQVKAFLALKDDPLLGESYELALKAAESTNDAIYDAWTNEKDPPSETAHHSEQTLIVSQQWLRMRAWVLNMLKQLNVTFGVTNLTDLDVFPKTVLTISLNRSSCYLCNAFLVADLVTLWQDIAALFNLWSEEDKRVTWVEVRDAFFKSSLVTFEISYSLAYTAVGEDINSLNQQLRLAGWQVSEHETTEGSDDEREHEKLKSGGSSGGKPVQKRKKAKKKKDSDDDYDPKYG